MIGTIAAILTTISFLPQAYQVIKTKDFAWNVCCFCFRSIFMDYSWY